MSYFDHVQCHTCGARMDPEKLVAGPGEGPACPYCGAGLNLTDLFGIKDSFVGHDDGEGNDHTLDDLVGGELYDGRYVDGRAPTREPEAPWSPQGSARSAPSGARPSGGGRPAAPSRPAITGPTAGGGRPPPAGSNAMVHQPRPADDTPAPPPPRRRPGQTPSAMDLLRDMKKKR